MLQIIHLMIRGLVLGGKKDIQEKMPMLNGGIAYTC